MMTDSLEKQILDDMLKTLFENAAFGIVYAERIKELTNAGQIDDAQKVITSLKHAVEVRHAADRNSD